MKNIVLYIAAMLMPITGISCRGMMHRGQTLDAAAFLMYEMPDSAMSVTVKKEPRLAEVMDADEEKADSIMNSVFSYYRKHGAKREKFDMYYILGRMYQLRGEEESAMFCYVSADEYSGDAPGPALRGCLYASMASLFEYGYRTAESLWCRSRTTG